LERKHAPIDHFGRRGRARRYEWNLSSRVEWPNRRAARTRWSGKPGSLFDLHRFLPDFRESFATGINEDGTIAGWGWDADNNARAIAWVPVPEPGTLAALGAGLLFLVSRRRAAKNKPKDSAGEQP
jgi:hypothetical protein